MLQVLHACCLQIGIEEFVTTLHLGTTLKDVAEERSLSVNYHQVKYTVIP